MGAESSPLCLRKRGVSFWMDTVTDSVMVAVEGVIVWEGVEVWNWGFC